MELFTIKSSGKSVSLEKKFLGNKRETCDSKGTSQKVFNVKEKSRKKTTALDDNFKLRFDVVVVAKLYKILFFDTKKSPQLLSNNKKQILKRPGL